MNTFLDYLNSIPAEQRDDFATRCDTSFDYLRQIAYGNRTCREALAINIDRESNGVITCEALRPDVDWAYLREMSKHARTKNSRATDKQDKKH